MAASTVAGGSGAPTVHCRVWVMRGPLRMAGSRTKSVLSWTVTDTMSPAATVRSPRSRFRLLFVPGTATPLMLQVTSSSWYFGWPVSTQTTSCGPTSPVGVCPRAMAFAFRRPVIR